MLACTRSSDAFDVRVSPPDPDRSQMVLALIRRAAFGTAFPRVSSWCDDRLRFVARVPHAPHAQGVGRAPHSRVSLRNGPSRTIPDSLRSPQGFEMRVARPHRSFSTVENKVTPSSRQHASATGNPREAFSLRRRTVAPRHSRILCTATGSAASPFLDSRKSVPSTSRANMRESIGVTGNPR